VLDLGPRARVAFAACFFAAELALLCTAPWRVDRVFGFQMFNASSDIEIRLARKLRNKRGRLIERAMPGGEWTATDARGQRHVFRWGELMRGTRLARIEKKVHAKDGVAAQLYHLQRALDHVAASIPDDAQTVALVARVRAIDNGHTSIETVLESRRR
jgi:hypothetical protein